MEATNCQVIPFVTHSTDLRVFKSPIGQVVPLVDVAKAIGYDRKTLADMIDRNKELFEGTVGVVTTLTVQNNRGTLAEQKYEVTALNVFGVHGLIMKLDYNRIQDPAKRDSIIRFQRWAMQTLGKAATGCKINGQPKEKKRHTVQFLQNASPAPEGMDTLTAEQAADRLGIAGAAIMRRLQRGKIKGYRGYRPNGAVCWVVSADEINNELEHKRLAKKGLTIGGQQNA